MIGEKAVEPGQEGPVTVSVSRKVKAGREADYEQWVKGITDAASEFPGHLGVSILRPSAKTDGLYVVIYRYDSWEHCQRWEQSNIRASWICRLAELVDGETQTQRVSGLEFWFDLPEVPLAAHAPRYKMAMVLIAVVFALVFPLQIYLGPVIADWPHWLHSLCIVVLQVLLMTYIVMPQVTRLLKPWLFKESSR